MGEWIRVEDACPPLTDKQYKCYSGHYWKSIRVLCACKQDSGKVFVKEGFCEVYSDGRKYWRIPGSVDSITHWMFMPEPPEELSEKNE